MRRLAMLLVLASACSLDDPAVLRVGLEASSCEDLTEAWRDGLRREWSEKVRASLTARLARVGQECTPSRDDVSYDSVGPSAGGSAPTSNESSGTKSETNNQVDGVDEPDRIKHDGRRLFIASAGQLVIVDLVEPAAPRVLSRTAIEGADRLVLEDGRAVVFSRISAGTECTYGYGCSGGGTGRTVITVLDVGDPSAPRVRRVIDATGGLAGARLVDGAVHTVLSPPAPQIGGLSASTWLPCDASAGEVVIAYLKLKLENERIIDEAWPGEVIINESLDGDGPYRLDGCENAFRDSGDADRRTAVVSFDIGDQRRARITTLLASPHAIMASGGALYLACRQTQSPGGPWYSGAASAATTIHKLRLRARPARTEVAGSGLIPGHVLNQFAMDEWQDHLRVATTSGHAFDPNARTQVVTLAEKAGELVETGRVGDLAPAEDIRSVRFLGARGYIVTFKKTDPLFAIDLADPTRPRVTGELKIPGFSTYLHPLDEGHLLAIGFDADDQGDFAWFQGMQLSIFDVRDPALPTLAHRLTLGQRGSSSAALTDHLAFTYLPATGMFAFPATVCSGASGGGSYATTVDFSGVIVYDVSAEDGFAELGRAAITAPTVHCRNWWTQSNSAVERTLLWDDWLLALTDAELRVVALGALGGEQAVVPLAP